MPRFHFRWFHGDPTAYAHVCLGGLCFAAMLFWGWVPEIWTPGIAWNRRDEIALWAGPVLLVVTRFAEEA